MKVVHYLNQFFAGLGGEEAADHYPEYREGPVGPGVRLNELLGGAAQVVGTLVAGDNYFSMNPTSSAEVIEELLRASGADLLIAGPAFNAGRYGLACGEVCSLAIDRLGMPALIAMSEDNPAVVLHRARISILRTSESINGMGQALEDMAAGTSAYLGSGGDWSAASSLMISRGIRLNEVSPTRGSTRAIDLLLSKIEGDSYTTEWPLPDYDIVEPSNLETANTQPVLALVTEGGLVPSGNPERLNSGRADRWFRYPVQGMTRLMSEEFDIIHGGIDTSTSNENPNRMLPLDIAREQEPNGRFSLYEQIYSTTGNQGSISTMQRIGDEIAAELHNAGVHAVIATST
tara:strand:- start:1539 stop:2576 length:1038 start_codon:yes stop_codon:yes gene_type:complete